MCVLQLSELYWPNVNRALWQFFDINRGEPTSF